MSDEKPRFADAIGALLEGEAGAGQHPSPEVLEAYQHHRLDPAAADGVQEHLAGCRECARLLLALGHLEAPAAEGEAGVTDLETEGAWRRLRLRLELESPAAAAGEERAPATGAPGGPRPARVPAAPARRPLYALAAALAAVAVGLSFWVGMLRGELARLRQPQLNLPIVNLEPVGMRRGAGEMVRVEGAAERFVVILNPLELPEPLPHEVEIRDAAGELVWSGHGLEPTPLGNFHLELSRRLLPAGEYRLRLLRGGAQVAEFSLQLSKP